MTAAKTTDKTPETTTETAKDTEKKTTNSTIIDATPAPTKPSLEIDQKVRLRAVYGRMINPGTLQEFTVDTDPKVVVDTWVKIQYDAGKLALADD